ncbi:Unknown protein [Striga hermonthica]|uniref:DUF4283 domain-containing protein n=1 Tax=Striga hermonthica TaxID=68872 RepID=A0A9N7RRD0_STRHE|nr:Unknown protein [Striga hermonthica]
MSALQFGFSRWKIHGVNGVVFSAFFLCLGFPVLLSVVFLLSGLGFLCQVLRLPGLSLSSAAGTMEDDLTDKLKKFWLSDKECSGLVVDDEDFVTGLEECQLSLTEKIFGEKRVNFSGLKATLSNIWITEQQFSIRNIGPNLFQFIFNLAEDKDKILHGKTWSFDGQYLLLKEWSPTSPNFNAEDEKIKIWVQVHNLPLYWITDAIGVNIGKVIGKVLDVK